MKIKTSKSPRRGSPSMDESRATRVVGTRQKEEKQIRKNRKNEEEREKMTVHTKLH